MGEHSLSHFFDVYGDPKKDLGPGLVNRLRTQAGLKSTDS